MKELKPKSQCVLYARKSTEEDDQQIMSIEAQLFELREFADRERIEIVKEFTEAKSAKKPRRDGFAKMLSMIETSKKTMFDMTNSDPYLILFWIKWLNRIFKIPTIELKAWLNIYPQQNEKHIKKFWSELTGIPVKNFGKSYVKPLSKNYKKNNLYYGTMRVGVPKSTDYRYRVFG
ncbi:MAG TPA: recombinase family protein [Candidatus Paceibacterota bacterium]